MIKELQKEKSKNVNVKIPISQYRELLKLAKKNTNGNMSAWIRWASIGVFTHKSDIKKIENEA